MFRFAAKRVFLTYSKVSDIMTKECVYYTIDERYPVMTYFVAEERHASGDRHIHAVFEFRHKIDSKDVTCFDVNDGWTQFHPNIQTIKKGNAHWERVLEYCDKEDPCPFTNTEIKPTWGEIVETANSEQDFMRLVRRHYPRDFALNHSRLEAMAKKVYPTYDPNTIESYSLHFSITMPPELLLFTPLPGHSTVVVGRPGCGKTTWAKLNAPKPSLFVRHLDSLAKLTTRHMSIIFDDLDFRHLPPATQKFLVDTQDISEIHIRYRVATIPAGLTRIFTCNEYPFLDEGVHGAAIDRRVNKLFIQ